MFIKVSVLEELARMLSIIFALNRYSNNITLEVGDVKVILMTN